MLFSFKQKTGLQYKIESNSRIDGIPTFPSRKYRNGGQTTLCHVR